MAKALSRQDFLVNDLAVSISGRGQGGTWLPADEDHTPPTPISPIAVVIDNLDYFEAIRATIRDAVKTGQFEEVGRAFVAGDTGGNALIRSAIQDIGAAVVAGAAFAGLGGEVGLVDPNCGGTSFETIPPTITPIVHTGMAVHKVSELPRLRHQLAEAVAYVDKTAEGLQPRGADAGAVREQLEGALKSMQR